MGFLLGSPWCFGVGKTCDTLRTGWRPHEVQCESRISMVNISELEKDHLCGNFNESRISMGHVQEFPLNMAMELVDLPIQNGDFP